MRGALQGVGPALLLPPARALDGLRARILRLIGPLLAPWWRDRDARVTALGAVSVVGALALAVHAPVLLLAWGPLCLGVPHLVADVRYLFVRRALHRRPAVWALVVAPACSAWILPHAAIPLLAVAGAGLCIEGSPRRRALVVALGVGLSLSVDKLGRSGDLAIAHGHNLVALALFVVWTRRRGRAHGALALGTLGAAGLLLAGGFDRWALPALLRGGPLALDRLVRGLAPIGDPVLGLRLVLVFAFLQSVHYGVWVRLVPELDRSRRGPRPFARSVTALADDLGWTPVLLAAMATVGLLGYGALDTEAARDLYLRLALFHGPLELGLAALLLAEGRLPLAERA